MREDMNERLLNDIEVLAVLFREGGWQELRITSEGLNLLLSQDPAASLDGLDVPTSSRAALVVEPTAIDRPVSSSAVVAAETARPGNIDPAWHAVLAPNLGSFYRSPKPGSPPFVELGQRVPPATELCLLEVMKLFTSVNAGVAGTIAQICVADADLVEGDQVLFYIKPD